MILVGELASGLRLRLSDPWSFWAVRRANFRRGTSLIIIIDCLCTTYTAIIKDPSPSRYRLQHATLMQSLTPTESSDPTLETPSTPNAICRARYRMAATRRGFHPRDLGTAARHALPFLRAQPRQSRHVAKPNSTAFGSRSRCVGLGSTRPATRRRERAGTRSSWAAAEMLSSQRANPSYPFMQATLRSARSDAHGLVTRRGPTK